jgi:hypothetical protein
VARHRAAFELLAIQAGQEFHKIVAGDRFQREFAFLGKVIELQQIAPVGRHGVGGETPLHTNVGEKGGDGGADVHQCAGNPSAGSRRIAMP